MILNEYLDIEKKSGCCSRNAQSSLFRFSFSLPTESEYLGRLIHLNWNLIHFIEIELPRFISFATGVHYISLNIEF